MHMNALRVFVGIACLGIASVMAWHVASLVRPVLLPTVRQLGDEETVFFVLRIAGFSLSGWRLLVFEAVVMLVAIVIALLGFYVLAHSRTSG